MVLNQFNQQQLILARSAATGIETYLGEVCASLQSATKIQAIRQMSPDCLQYMKQMYTNFIPRTSIRRLDENGILRFIYPFEGWRGEQIGRDYSEETFFKKAKDTRNACLSGIIINEHGDRRIRIPAPIYLETPAEPKKEKFKGVLVISFDLATIAKTFISSIVSGKSGYAYLINQDGLFLAHYESEFVGRNAFDVRAESNPELSYESINQIQQNMIAGKEGTGRYVSGWHRKRIGKIEKLIAYSPVHINDITWSVAVCAPVDEVDLVMRTEGRTALCAFSFIVLILLSAGMILLATVYRWSHFLELEVEDRTKELKESEAKYRSMIDDALNNISNIALFVLDSDFRVVWINQALEHYFGLRKNEVIGKDKRQLINERIKYIFEDPEYFTEKVINTYDNNTYIETFECHVLRNSNRRERWLEHRSQPIETGLYAGGRIEFYVDITERKHLEKRLTELEKHRFEIEKLAAAGQVAARVAHEINNPLGGIKNSFLLIKDAVSEKHPYHQYVGLIEDEIDRITRIVRQMFGLYRPDREKMREFQISMIIDDVVDLLNSIRRNKGITIEITAGPEIVSGIPESSLRQVLYNIILNAIQASRQGGMVRVKSKVDTDVVTLTISDEGSGIPAEIRSLIFKPFTTTKQGSENLGLGLSISKEIIEGLGGSIACESVEGKGTVFTIIILCKKGGVPNVS
jgi:PAS domain S-box-containing protein